MNVIKKIFYFVIRAFQFKWLAPILLFIPIILKSWFRNITTKSYIKKTNKIKRKRDGESLSSKVTRYNKKR